MGSPFKNSIKIERLIMLRVDEQFVYDYIASMGGMSEITEIVSLIQDYHQKEWYPSKREILDEWEIGESELYELIISIFTVCLQEEQTTYQCMCGILQHKIKVADELHRIKIIADIIGLCTLTDLIDMNSERGEYHMLSTPYEFEDCLIPQPDKYSTIFGSPHRIISNFDKEYGTGSVLLGHSMNHHEENVVLSHLNRVFETPLCISKKFIDTYEPTPKEEHIDGRAEMLWELNKDAMLAKMQEIVDTGNRFYDKPSLDFRGRTYVKSSYQGTSFQKATVELYHKEVVIGE